MGQIFSATTVAADAPDIEGGLYDAKFEGVSVKFVEGGQFGDGDRYVWEFTLLDDDGAVLYDDGDPITVDGLTSMSLNAASRTKPKALRYLQALLTEAEYAAFLEAKGIDSDALLGRIVQVDVAIRENGWPSVANVLPRRTRRASRSAASEAEFTLPAGSSFAAGDAS